VIKMVLVFDVSAEIALFRKSYTTTSMVSYAFPPPTAVAGLIGAIVGLNNGAAKYASNAEFWEKVKGLSIAISLKSPLNWMSAGVNLLKLKGSTMGPAMKEHIIVKHQFVKKPRYRIYVKGETELYHKLATYLKNGEFEYTPYLGVAYALAEINYLGEVEEEPLKEEEISLDTIVPLYPGVEVDVLKTGGIYKEIVPFIMNSRRRVENNITVIYPDYKKRMAKTPPIYLKEIGKLDATCVGNEKVGWFNAW